MAKCVTASSLARFHCARLQVNIMHTRNTRTAIPSSVLETVINAQQNYVNVSCVNTLRRMLLESDSKYTNYGEKLVYAPK